MDLLKERIMQEGRCFPGGILKVITRWILS